MRCMCADLCVRVCQWGLSGRQEIRGSFVLPNEMSYPPAFQPAEPTCQMPDATPQISSLLQRIVKQIIMIKVRYTYIVHSEEVHSILI